MTKTKDFTIYGLDDKSCTGGKMWKADGPAIKKAINDGKITQNDTWDCDKQKLIERLKSKGVI